MKVHLRIESGERAGETLVFERDRIAVGRHPRSDLRFDAERDLEVSARHALIVRQGHRWFVRDLDSRNGTFVNGMRVTGDHDLDGGDRVSFGEGGPTVVLLLPGAAPAVAPVATTVDTAVIPSDARRPPGEETLRVRARVAKETRVLRWLSGTLLLALVTVAATLLASNQRQRAGWERERSAMLGLVDSLLTIGEESRRSLEGELDGVARALSQSEGEVRRLREALEGARSEDGRAALDELRAELQAATVALRRQQLAASIDYQAIEERNRPAVATIWVDFGDGEVQSATAFSVGDSGLLMTNRHVVHGPAYDREPERLAVRFSGSSDTWPAEVVAGAPDRDVAVVRARGASSWPAPVRFNTRADTIPSGRPLVLIGYPLGGGLPGPDDLPTRPRPITSTAVLVQWREQRLELQGYGAEGASGSPVFDEWGQVVAVLQGSIQGDDGATLTAVPASAALALLREHPGGR